MVGAAKVEQPKGMWKDVVRCLNELLHAWKDCSLMYVLSALGLRPKYGQPILSCHDVANRARVLLNMFSFLRESPEEDNFTAAMFHHMVIHRVFECKPELWLHINVNAPHDALDNLFALRAAAIAANIRDYQLGSREIREVSVDNWVGDYGKACALIRDIRQDIARQARMNDLQWWIMDLGMNIVSESSS